jgi:hypothetical protein
MLGPHRGDQLGDDLVLARSPRLACPRGFIVVTPDMIGVLAVELSRIIAAAANADLEARWALPLESRRIISPELPPAPENIVRHVPARENSMAQSL